MYNADAEYSQQCRENGSVDANGKLAMWVSEANDGGWWLKDYEAVVLAERQQAPPQKGKGGGKAQTGTPSTAPPRSGNAPVQWNSKKDTRTASSSVDVSWTASSSSNSYWNYSIWNR